MKKIQVYLTGRLGNQLFQYAIAKNIQKKYGGKILCNVYELKHRSKELKYIDIKFKYDMENFESNKNCEVIDQKLPWYADLSNFFVKIIKKLFPKLYFKAMLKFGYLIWLRTEYMEIPELKTENITLLGFWQDFRYFKNVEEELKNEITPTISKNIVKNKIIYDLSQEENSVCISIRGSDYLHPHIKKKTFVCDKKYFDNAILKANEIISNPKFVIFSDDLNWVINELKFEERFPNNKFYYESGDDSVEEKVNMMTSFKNFIISNSTFSWWVQYLSKRPAIKSQ